MPINLNRLLGHEAVDLNFFQAVYLLEQIFPKRGRVGTGDELSSEPVRFETHNSLAFPPGEIAGVNVPLSLLGQLEEQESLRVPGQAEALALARRLDDPIAKVQAGLGPLRMELTFMGLYGVSSPLPSYFIDPITLRKVEFFQLKKFLDIFNHRLYSLFYRAWKKYRHPIQYLPRGQDDYTQRLLALTGQWPWRKTSTPSAGATPDLQRIPYARLLMGRVRSAKGLEQFLRGYFGFPKVIVREFVSQRLEVPVKAQLGSPQSGLGLGMRLGHTTTDYTGSFSVVLDQLPAEFLPRFLPQGIDPKKSSSQRADLSLGLGKTVRRLIDAYLRDPLDYTVEARILTPPSAQRGLGFEQSLLGMGTSLSTSIPLPLTLRF